LLGLGVDLYVTFDRNLVAAVL